MIGKRRVVLLLTILTIGCAGTGIVTTPTRALAYEQDVADVSVFYEPLAPYGTWLTLEGYGQVWRPRHIHAQWRPYTDGRWIYTEYGWTWVSDWPWGWAPFHYGRWYSHSVYGWVWIPGTVWAPAWVAWRYAPGWAGWAPLPPEAVWTPGIGLTVAHIEVIQPTSYCFVETHRLLDRHVHRYIASPTSNVHLIRRTRDVTRYAPTRQYVANQSLSVEDLEKDTKTRVPRYRITEATSPDTETRTTVRDRERTVTVFRPSRAPRERTPTDDGQPSAPPPAGQRPELTSPEPRHPRSRLEDRSTTTGSQPQPETRPPVPPDQPARIRLPRQDGQQDQAPVETGHAPVIRQPRPAPQPQERRRRPVQSQEDQEEVLQTPTPGGTGATPPPRRLSPPGAPPQAPAERPRRSPQTRRQLEEERRTGGSSPPGNVIFPPAGAGALPSSRRTPMSPGPNSPEWSRQQ